MANFFKPKTQSQPAANRQEQIQRRALTTCWGCQNNGQNFAGRGCDYLPRVHNGKCPYWKEQS
jgi:hypothetical protein